MFVLKCIVKNVVTAFDAVASAQKNPLEVALIDRCFFVFVDIYIYIYRTTWISGLTFPGPKA